jgi:hypothetical protein
MLTTPPHRRANPEYGHFVLEALISASLTLIAGAGLWKLVTSTRHLAEAGFTEGSPACETPQCSELDYRVVCECGEQHFVILR